MKKDILFYSNFCTYSKEIINQISKTSLNENVLYVCVDDDNIQLPPFITSVPTIYLTTDKKIVVDETILEWIKEKVSQTHGPTDTPDELQAYFGGCGDSFGLNCSTIDNKEVKPFISSFTFIGDDNGNTMAANDPSKTPTSNTSFDAQFNNLQASRNNEFKTVERR